MAVDMNALVKRILGHGFNARDDRRVAIWVESQIGLLNETLRKPFVDTVLNERDSREVAAELGIAFATVRQRVAKAFRVLEALARALPKDRFDKMFASVFDHEFGEEVKTAELTKVLYGRYDRRGTQTIAVKFIPRVQRGEIQLPMPEKRGKFWVWTKAQADAWRKWFATRNREEETPGG